MNCIYMDSSLVFPFKLRLHHHYLPLRNHFRRRQPHTSSHLHHAAAKKPLKKVHCQFEPKVNGARSPDSDSRFLELRKALDAAMNDINSSFGRGSVTRLGSAGGALVETFPRGCLTIDLALGGGPPKEELWSYQFSLPISCFFFFFFFFFFIYLILINYLMNIILFCCLAFWMSIW